MKYLKKFNESRSGDFADYLYSLFEVEPDDEVLQGDDWYFARWFRYHIESDKIDSALKSKRFSDSIVIKSTSAYTLDILIVSPDYYKSNSQWIVSNLKWEKHPIAVEMEKNPMLKSLNLVGRNAKFVQNLPNDCSLIKGMRFDDDGSGGLEFWPRKHLENPIYVSNEVELQALIYKYICDEKTNEGFLDFFKSKEFYKAGKEWNKIVLNGINVHLQPGAKIEKDLLEDAIEKIKKIKNEWYLVDNRCEVYYREANEIYFISSDNLNSINIKFRISDSEGDNEFGTLGQIPTDIKSEIVSDFHKAFGKHGTQVDEFPDRGYIIFDVCIRR